jgi:hypothetical protein
MNTPTVYNLGPHQYQIRHSDGGPATMDKLNTGHLEVWYNLFGCHGHRVGGPLPGRPNAWGWRKSFHYFPATLAGADEALEWARHLLRPIERNNDVH